ncbi:cupin domain-containing protein [Fimbriiglobus ruber]|uniref:Pectin degradation protein KdgF n=1 Tax=Fimbriiglobus ruber TaxID=1908690 RepID=A0A225D665_9BACT|nr:cupin domain-containing protein [Fimbriiglobus ruber]OWK36473.1 Pectin degradation protein KdgF [Fimbriiglobus ruber]
MSRFFPVPGECGHHTIFGATHIRTYAGDHLQLSLVDIPAQGVVDWHQHANEQAGMMVAGQATFYIGEEVKTLGPGDFYFIPGGVRHRVVADANPAQALDVFYPIRDEYR